MIRFGPAGFGGAKEAVSNLEEYHKVGLMACEIPFTYGVFIKEDKHKDEIVAIRETAKRLGIRISIHAPYWINLNSKDKRKADESRERILSSCRIGELIGAGIVVFHAGFYGKDNQEITYQNIKKAVLDIQEELKKNNWRIKIAAETMGKINVFGSADEILRLVKETHCEPCLDFAHLHARSLGRMSYKEIYEKFKHLPSLHCHFSGIEYGEKGERNHKLTEEKEIKKLLGVLPKNKEITIINESPNPVGDSIKMLKICKEL